MIHSWHPWRVLRSLAHVTLRFADLGDNLLGRVDYKQSTITLNTGMSQAERRSTLTHELIHLERGPCPAPGHRREEAAVEKESARRLIPIRDLGYAVAWSDDVTELADELWVDEDTVRVRLAHLHPAERAYLNGVRARRDDHDHEEVASL